MPTDTGMTFVVFLDICTKCPSYALIEILQIHSNVHLQQKFTPAKYTLTHIILALINGKKKILLHRMSHSSHYIITISGQEQWR